MAGKKSLYLVPNFLHPDSVADELPLITQQKAASMQAFVAESSKNLRAFYKKIQGLHPQPTLEIIELNEHSRGDLHLEWEQLFQNFDEVGLLSDAGYPCVADPGHALVSWCHERHIQVVPLPGSSSFLLALAASGLNGQSFTFHGYFPRDTSARKSWAKQIQQSTIQAHIIMETPYRNQALFDFLITHLPENWRLAYCEGLGGRETVMSKLIFQWKQKPCICQKAPAVFVIGKS